MKIEFLNASVVKVFYESPCLALEGLFLGGAFVGRERVGNRILEGPKVHLGRCKDIKELLSRSGSGGPRRPVSHRQIMQ